MMKHIGLIALIFNLALTSAAVAGGYENGSGYGGSSGASSGGSTTCSGDINSACSQVTGGSHLASRTVPDAALQAAPAVSGANLTASTVPNSALATSPLNASNISSGTLGVAQGGSGSSTLGGFWLPPTVVTGAVLGQNVLLLDCTWSPGFSAQWRFSYFINTADSANKYDVCLYSLPSAFGAGTASAGTLVTDIGAQTGSSTALTRTIAPLQNAGCTGANAPSNLCTGDGTGTLPTLPFNEPAGYYCIGWTTNSTTMKIGDASGNVMIPYESQTIVTSGGQCPTTTGNITIAPVANALLMSGGIN